MRMGSGAQHEASIAIGAFDIFLVAHLQIDLGMAERSANSITGDAGIIHFDGLGHVDRHGGFSVKFGADHSHGKPCRNCQEMLLEQGGFRA